MPPDHNTPRGEGRGPLALDTALVVFTAVVTVLALVGSTRLVDRTEAGGSGWLLAPALAGVLLLRRWAPVLVLVASIVMLIGYYASGRPAVGLELPLAAAFFSAAEQGRVRAAAVTAGILVLFTPSVRIGFGQDPLRLLTLELPVTIVVLAGAIGAGDAVRSRRLRVAAEVEHQRLLAAERAAEARALVDAERREVAREVHDVLGHSMVVIGLQADVALDALDDRDQVEESLRDIHRTARTGLVDIRRSVHLLAAAGESREPVATLTRLAELLARLRAAGLVVRLHETGAPAPISVPVSATAYRVVQEALTNVVKHSAAREADVEVRYEPTALVVTVTDPGPQASATNPADVTSRNGLAGLAERVAMVGGEFDRGILPDCAGFRVSARLPLRDGEGFDE
ncbi:MAG: histidine kinase [Propionibacteriaceae bacterium]|nr:histidine kinase [Propionibacteriaceae bacterium]